MAYKKTSLPIQPKYITPKVFWLFPTTLKRMVKVWPVPLVHNFNLNIIKDAINAATRK